MKTSKWKICIDNPFANCDHIYPIQQKKVRILIDEILTNDKNIETIIVFGSSVSARCHIGSDVDIYVKTKNTGALIKNYIPFEYDLWTDDIVDERLKKEILKTGVVVYGKDVA